MSIKRYCDICRKEIQTSVIDAPLVGDDIRLGLGEMRLRNAISFTVSARLNGTDSDLCRYCLIDAINELDDRACDQGDVAS